MATQRHRLSECSSLLTQSGSAKSLRDEIGLFPFAGTNPSMLNPPGVGAARSRWPEVLWRRCALAKHSCTSVYTPPLSDPSGVDTSRPLFHSREIARQRSDLGPRCIQQASLSRNRVRTPSALRREMLPRVERGPPICSSGRAASRARAFGLSGQSFFFAIPHQWQ